MHIIEWAKNFGTYLTLGGKNPKFKNWLNQNLIKILWLLFDYAAYDVECNYIEINYRISD